MQSWIWYFAEMKSVYITAPADGSKHSYFHLKIVTCLHMVIYFQETQNDYLQTILASNNYSEYK